MLKNYFVTALRSFQKNKLTSFVNILGLSIGLTCALSVFLFIQYELSVDRFIKKIDQLYLITVSGENRDTNCEEVFRSDIIETLAAQLLQDYPEISDAVRLMPWSGKIESKKRWIREPRIWFADPHVFNMLGLPLRHGIPETALRAPNSVVITPDMAVKYFGDKDPVGKTLKVRMSLWPASYTFTVTGILEPLPKTASMKIDFLAHVPFNRLSLDRKISSGDRYIDAWAMTLVRLPDSNCLSSLRKKLAEHQCLDRDKGFNFRKARYHIEPFKNAYLSSKATFYEADANPHEHDETMRTSDIRLLVFLTALGCVILIVSCINIINLTTARAALRSREIGIRKVIGAKKRQLVVQFIAEAILLSFAAVLIALILTELLLPYFNTLIKRELSINYAGNWIYLVGIVAIATLTGLLSGLYPAFILSSLKPITALKSIRLKSSIAVRQGLMMTQIVVCVTVCLFALVMLNEIKAVEKMDIGMHNENLIFFELNDVDMKERYPAFKNEILRIPGVESMTASSFVPWQYGIIFDVSWYNEDVATQTKIIAADTSFLETYRLSITDGEPFKTDRLKMDGYILINESARRRLRSKGTDPLSRNICLGYGWCNRVCGIIKDFYFLYPTKRIRPLAILSSRYLAYLQNQMTVRLTEGNHDNVILMIEEKVKRFFPNAPFEYKYVAREMEKMHAEKMGYRWMALMFTTGFALLIAAIGLFGFATYETQRCTKEIGIRKALGGKPMQIGLHFIMRFTKLTLIANVISWPISYFLIHRILKMIDYPNPVQIRTTYFLWAGFLTLALTIVTVWIQTYRAATIDPVRALRYE